MSKTAAERQAAYRARRAFVAPQGDGERRLSTRVSTAATFALARLAHHYGVTQRAMLERIPDRRGRVLRGKLLGPANL